MTAEMVSVSSQDVARTVSDLRSLRTEAQLSAVTEMLGQARFGLQVASAAQDLPGIVEWKAKGAAIQEITKQLQLGKDMQLDAAEFVRRAERGLGVAIREGQQRGDILRRGQTRTKANQNGELVQYKNSAPSPVDFAASQTELSGTGLQPGIYALTDCVSDEQFEEAIAEARREGNLSRAEAWGQIQRWVVS
ncbi:hypothetical protein ACK280_26355 [Mycobacterium sherrisii]|uniref:hypothetical protein n=1 Tax=Mycobacterium sherrisii TaxID=243061 RepID=UPI00397591F6